MAVEQAGPLPVRRRMLGVIPIPRRISLSVTLATGIGALVFVAVLLVLGLSLTANRLNTHGLLSDKAELLLTLAESRLGDHLRPAESQVTHIAGMIHEGEVDPADPERLLTTMAGSMAGVPQVLAMVYWDAAETAMGVARFPEGGVVRIEAPLKSAEMDELRASLVGREGLFWGDVVYIEERRGSALTLRHPLRPAGVLAAIVSVMELSRFLAEMDGGVEGAVPFILYGEGRVLAHPNLAFGHPGLSADKRLPSLYEVGDPLLVALWTRGEKPAVEPDGVEAAYVDLADEEHFMLYRRIEGFATEPLILGIRFPVASVNQELERMANSGIAGLVLLIIAVLAGIVMGKRIARPVIQLAEQASQVAGLEFAKTTPLPGSVFTELDDQARAFNRMLAGLKWFETYVPRSLVRRLMAKQTDEQVRSIERELTVLFTDIAGFTSASEGMPAAATAGFLNGHFALLAACIEAEGGTIDKFIGDSVMAFWGAPERQPDHADRACRAALAMAAAIREDNARRKAEDLPPVRMRVGIHSGPMVVGNIGAPGRMNYTIVGDAVNIGNRIEQLSKELGGDDDVSILISGATAERLGGEFAPASRGRHAVRGRQEDVEVFRLE